MRVRAPILLGGLVLVLGLGAAAGTAPSVWPSGPGGGRGPGPGPARASAGTSAAAVAVDLTRTRPLGRGPAYRLAARDARVAAGRPVDGLRCGRAAARPYAAHLELFAGGRVLPVPAGIGWAAPVTTSGARVSGGRCAYRLRTDDPAGLVIIGPGPAAAPTTGALFTLWGQPLDAHRVAGFTTPARMHAFLNGRRWGGDPRSIPLGRHAQVELEIGGWVDPHPGYAFPAGL